MDNTKVINVLSFCTGYGGIELGLSRVFENPLRCVAVEIEAFAVANLVAKAEQGKLAIEAVYSDLKKFPASKFRGCFDIITAGYPCQPFSHAGKRKGKADPRHLWPFIRDHIGAVRPLLVICENVAGHLSLGFDRVVSDLDDLGYTTAAGIYAAEEVGAPHRRERLFIVAHSDSYGRSEPGFMQTAGKHDTKRRTKCLKELWPLRAGDKTGRLSENKAGTGEPEVAERVGRRGRDHGEPAGSGPMDDAERAEPRAGVEGIETKEGCRRDRPADTGCELADSDGTGCKEQRGSVTIQPEHAAAERGGHRRLASKQRKLQPAKRWPARPGQPQHEWEPPRTILSAADHKILKGYVEKYQTFLTAGQVEAMAHAEALYAPEPKMGRAAYGFASRVDELRLLGNGVVPGQLAMAIAELLGQLKI